MFISFRKQTLGEVLAALPQRASSARGYGLPFKLTTPAMSCMSLLPLGLGTRNNLTTRRSKEERNDGR
jgi:hypothetical protein